jgi:hypothetical protein
MIVDTASMLTLVNEKLMPADFNCAETVTLRGLRDQPVIGRIVCETLLEINGIKVHWDVCVVPLDDDAILGLDILDTLGAVINLRIPSVTLNGKLTQAYFVEGFPSELCQRVYIRRTITVPPNSEMTVSVSTNKNIDQEFIIEPTAMTTGILISHVVGKGRQCPITLIKDGNRFVKIKKGTPVGYLEEIETVEEEAHYEVFDVDSSKRTTRYQVLNNICLTCHLTDLYERSIKHLNSEEQKLKLRRLLVEYQDVFSRDGCITRFCSISLILQYGGVCNR